MVATPLLPKVRNWGWLIGLGWLGSIDWFAAVRRRQDAEAGGVSAR